MRFRFSKISNAQRLVVGFIFLSFALILIPWTIYLSNTLPGLYVVKDWGDVWVGLNILIIISFIFTTILILYKSKWVIVSLSSGMILLFLDAWLDLSTSWRTHTFYQAVILAIFVEIPLSILSFLYIDYLLKKYIN
jgi:hypothetical protein